MDGACCAGPPKLGRTSLLAPGTPDDAKLFGGCSVVDTVGSRPKNVGRALNDGYGEVGIPRQDSGSGALDDCGAVVHSLGGPKAAGEVNGSEDEGALDPDDGVKEGGGRNDGIGGPGPRTGGIDVGGAICGGPGTGPEGGAPPPGTRPFRVSNMPCTLESPEAGGLSPFFFWRMETTADRASLTDGDGAFGGAPHAFGGVKALPPEGDARPIAGTGASLSLILAWILLFACAIASGSPANRTMLNPCAFVSWLMSSVAPVSRTLR